jgi:hypothetical protein
MLDNTGPAWLRSALAVMKRHRRKFVFVGAVLVVLYVGSYMASLFCGEADYQRALHGEKPSFAWRKWVLTDGGTTGYQGVGYTILRIHSFHEMTNYHSGASLRYQLRWLFPFDRRSDREQTEVSNK